MKLSNNNKKKAESSFKRSSAPRKHTHIHTHLWEPKQEGGEGGRKRERGREDLGGKCTELAASIPEWAW